MSTADRMRELLATYRRCQVSPTQCVTLTVPELAELVCSHDAWKVRAERAEAAVDVQMARVATLRGRVGTAARILTQEDAA